MFKNQKGFTLVELIVVIVIIGILAAIAVPKFADLSTSAKTAACKQNQAAIESAMAIKYANDAITNSAAGVTVTTYETVQANLVPAYLKAEKSCPDGTSTYTLNADGTVTCANGAHVRT